MTATGGHYKTGQQFGPFTLEAYLGSGAFKSVYRAHCAGQSGIPDSVALGFPHQQDAEGLVELQKEFALVQRMDHPNILRVYGIQTIENVTFLVMELIEGESLRARLRREKCLPQDQAIRLTGLICEALTYAHAAHILHRDIKPENVLLTAEGVPKLLDFGVGRLLAHTISKASTQIGTVDYMAPEQMQGAAGVNADLWALGVTLYEMLVGVRPFAGEMGQVVHRILSARYDERPLFDKGIDRTLIRILRKMLNKDPEGRYQTAEELVRDLESVARRTRLTDDDEGRLEVLVAAHVPLVYILSYEEDRVLQAVRSIVKRLAEDRRRPRKLYIWSVSRGLRDEADKLVHPGSTGDPTNALIHVIQNLEDAVYVFLDLHRHFSPVTTRLIRDAARAVRSTHKSVLMISPAYSAPDELEKEVNLSVFQLPDRGQLEPLISQVAEETQRSGLSVTLSEEDRARLIRAASGLTESEATLAMRGAVVRCGGLTANCIAAVADSKTQAIRKSGILEYYHQSESFADVGGLQRLLAWFKARAGAFASTQRYAGLPMPRGVLLVGVPGCGKSLSARALAGTWGVPLVRLDVGRIFGSLVGQSEANLRMAIQTAEAVSPCILWIDEVEKGFAGVHGHGGGVATRVFGTFLNWLQDKRSPVFVVATANDLTGIPPEFLRQGRFDDIFFVGLPEAAERETILSIHLRKRKRDPQQYEMTPVVKATEGFSGAELEQLVVAGLFTAFDANRELTSMDLVQAAAGIYPLARSRAREIGSLTAWAQHHARMAS